VVGLELKDPESHADDSITPGRVSLARQVKSENPD